MVNILFNVLSRLQSSSGILVEMSNKMLTISGVSIVLFILVHINELIIKDSYQHAK